jgi:hypothetical protein
VLSLDSLVVFDMTLERQSNCCECAIMPILQDTVVNTESKKKKKR